MKQQKLHIKNMVCQRCIMTVENMLEKLQIPVGKVSLGEIELTTEPTSAQLEGLQKELKKTGFELIESRTNQIVETIKRLVLDYARDESGEREEKLSSVIGKQLHYDYSYLSDIFSSIEGITIEQYLIVQRIEKVKELLVYEQLSLTEIAYRLGFSSVHHLSAQFKKVTGLTPSHFKKIGADKRKSIDLG